MMFGFGGGTGGDGSGEWRAAILIGAHTSPVSRQNEGSTSSLFPAKNNISGN